MTALTDEGLQVLDLFTGQMGKQGKGKKRARKPHLFLNP